MTENTALAERSATYGGAGWRNRRSSHREDVEAGAIWRRCGSDSETSPLLAVALARPHPGWFPGGNPQDFLLWRWPNAARLQSQAALIAAFYESRGVAVHWIDPGPQAPPNFLFQRDLFFMTPEGAVLARPAAEQRTAETRLAAAGLATLGVPILATPLGDATFEGADALWLDRSTVLLGTGIRTNPRGAQLLRGLLGEMHINMLATPLEGGIQHLLGAVNFAGPRVAVVRSDHATGHLLGILRDWRYDIVVCEAGAEIVERLGMNFVAMAPLEIVMPAGCPAVRARLSSAGIAVHELDIGEYRNAAGGLGCLTGILHRGPGMDQTPEPAPSPSGPAGFQTNV